VRLCYVPAIGAYFLGHWEVHLLYPATSFLLVAASLTEALLFHPFAWASATALTATAILFLYSGIGTIAAGPGYLPWCYPDRPEDALSGVASTDAQCAAARAATLPARTNFFASARRIVIRPDHSCQWLASFIGKRNHKLFFVFHLWGIAYLLLYLRTSLSTLAGIRTIFAESKLEAAVISLCGLFAVVFLWYLASGFVPIARHVHQNRTRYETFKNIPPATFLAAPWWRNWEEVFGSVSEWYLWLVPVPAFRGIDDWTLAERFMFAAPSKKRKAEL
jgi:hypothetical protein